MVNTVQAHIVKSSSICSLWVEIGINKNMVINSKFTFLIADLKCTILENARVCILRHVPLLYEKLHSKLS